MSTVKNDRYKAHYKLGVELKQSLNSLTASMDTEKLVEVLQAYFTLMRKQDEGAADEVTISREIVAQMAVFAAHSVNRTILDKIQRS